MSSARRTPVDLRICDLEIECESWSTKRPNGLFPVAGALLRARGVYPRGSAGKDHAMFLKWRIDELCDLVRPQGLVVDLRELDYTWGDDLSVTPRADVAIVRAVVREERRTAFVGVLGERDVRTDLDATLLEVDEHLRAIRPPKRPI